MGSRNNKPGRIVKGTAKQPNLKDASGIWTLDEAMQAHRANAWPQPNLFQPVANSLRLKNSSASALVRQPGRPGNQRTWTWSAWIKLGIVSGTREFFNGSPSGTAFSGIRTIDGQIYIQDYSSSGGYNIWWISTALYRDTSAWYHIVVKYDTTQTQGNAAILYVNGVQQVLTFNAAVGAYVQNRASWINAANTQRFGQNIGGDYYDGQIGEVNFVDGYALQPTLFGQFDSNNTWVPVPYTGTYGTNGFYLPFTNATTSQTLGYDASLNGTTTYDADQDPYRGNVTLHLTGNGPAGGNNNTFVDSSSNNLAITRGGDTTQGSFSPFPMQNNTPYNPAVHGASAYFDGSGDRLSLATNTSLDLTGDFTIEMWANLSSLPSYSVLFNTSSNGTAGAEFTELWVESTGVVVYYVRGSALMTTASSIVTANTWHHIAIVKSGSSQVLYVNGVSRASATSSTQPNTGYSWFIGDRVAGAGSLQYPLSGYISNFRITKGSAIYTAAFTPTMRPFGALTNNIIRFSEDFTNSYWTVNAASITPGATIAPDGTPTGALFAWTTATAQHYIIRSSLTTSGDTVTASVYVKAKPNSAANWMIFGDLANNYMYINLLTGTIGFLSQITNAAVTSVGNGWFRVSGTWTSGGASSGWGTYVASADNVSNPAGTDTTSGFYIWGAQLEAGTTLSNYTPTPANYSTAPSLLLNFANAAVTDTAGGDNIVTGSTATITNASKYGSGAMTFNGTSDFVAARSTTSYTFGTANFTIEYWVYFNSVAATQCVAAAYDSNGADATSPAAWTIRSNGVLSWEGYFGSTSFVGTALTPTATVTANTWHHVATVRNNGEIIAFLNGRVVGRVSVGTAAVAAPGGGVHIGRAGLYNGQFFNGSVDDFRVTKGVARYTSDFAPPARALPETGGKSFVTTNVNAGVVRSFTTTGSTSWTAPVDVTSVEVLVVAGGGGGANYNSAGGGGAGGLIYNNAYPVTPGQTYTVTVGAGGVGGGVLGNPASDALAAATSGGNSVFGALVAIGGGNGGQGNVQGSRTGDVSPGTGGSGGGARAPSAPTNVGGAGTAGQGFAGGNSGTYSGPNYPGGGGGGAGGVGGPGVDATTGGNGGVGLQFGISGTSTYYAGGGGGSTQGSGTTTSGGLGGGGAGGGGSGGAFATGVSGTANTGGGGGAGGYNGTTGSGGAGGSGIVVVRYTTTAVGNTSDATSDNLVDSPTLYGHDYGLGGEVVGNYATWNPLLGANNQAGGGSTFASSVVVYSGGNLNASNPTAGGQAPRMQCHSNIGMPSGKWYAEFTGLSGRGVGISLGDYVAPSGAGSGVSHSMIMSPTSGAVSVGNGASATVTGTAVAISTTDVVGVAFDADNRVCYYYRNGVLTQTASNITTTSGTPYFASNSWFFSSSPESSGAPSAIIANFGQRAWAYTPPAGFNALTTKNFARPAVGSAAANPNQFFDTVTWTGTGAAQTITLPGAFQPDLVWTKSRSFENNHHLFDSVRGSTVSLKSNTTAAEDVRSTTLQAFNSNGFSLGAAADVNGSGSTYVAWCWKAGGAAVSNTSGTLTSQVSANTASGFSIVTYTGTGVNATVGHGLGVAPSMYICKRRNSTSPWRVYHTSLSYTTYINLSDSGAAASDSSVWNSAPTTSVFGIGTNDMNTNTGTYVAYCWAEISGFSKFGSYVGNGSADGPFVYTGFRPAFILTKDITTGSYWWEMVDSARAPFNPSDKTLYANVADSEYSGSGYNKDLLSNGFKIRGTSGGHNTSGSTYIYMAFAGKPFGNVNGVAR